MNELRTTNHEWFDVAHHPELVEGLRTLCICDCGLADYRKVLDQQHQLHEERRQDKIPDTVLIMEHPPVITLGARQIANKLLVSREELTKKGIDVVKIRRGGGTTAHNPGQLVFYPILHLQQLGLGISEYIRELEAIGMELLEKLGVRSTRRKGFPGLWVKHNRQSSIINHQSRKIASIGVRVSKGVTYHGMAININNDLSIFDLVVPCGLDGVEMTSVLKETGRKNSMAHLKENLAKLLMSHFCESTNNNRESSIEHRRLPPWLHRPLPANESFRRTEQTLSSLGLQTICSNANCPNRGECWSKGTATVLILGNVCTQHCGFCSVATGKPAPPDPTEPGRLAQLAKQLALKYLVITSVNRDDLPDGGASHFRNCINTVRQHRPDIKFEILTPDFCNCQTEALKILREALPFVFAHNVETVPSLYPLARAGGNYKQSLNLLKMAKEYYGNVQTKKLSQSAECHSESSEESLISTGQTLPHSTRLRLAQGQGDSFEIVTKSSIMLGLGETDDQVEEVLKDLRNVGCDRITIGQYLKPSKNSLDVVEYLRPSKFDWWKQKALQLGFSWVMSSPFARSSYFAEQETSL